MSPENQASALHLRHPTVADGAAIWRLVIDAGTLDRNSSYLYLLLCHEFADCCAVAEKEGRLQGFTTGYRSAARPDVWFLWQIGVAEEARGQGLAKRMAGFVLNTLVPGGVRFLETTVAQSNEASRALFRGIAREFDTELTERELFTRALFPDSEGDHEAEPLLRLGPFDTERMTQTSRNRD